MLRYDQMKETTSSTTAGSAIPRHSNITIAQRVIDQINGMLDQIMAERDEALAVCTELAEQLAATQPAAPDGTR